MRSSKSLIVGIVSACLCAGCVFAYLTLVNEQVDQARAESLARYGGDQLVICVAKRTIAAGETITDSMLENQTWVADLLPEGVLASSEEVVGKEVSAAIYAGEPIVANRLGSSTVTLEVPDGFTAVSVPARKVQAVGGSLSSGMYVDVYATGSSATTLLLSHSLILATSLEQSSSSSDSVAWIVLAVEPEHVQELIAAAENLELSFALPKAVKEA